MQQEERRSEDSRISEMHSDIKEILGKLNNVCVEVAVVKRSNEATQRELEDHKEYHKVNKENGFRITDLVLSIGILILGIFDWLKK